jgi:adenylate cyclase
MDEMSEPPNEPQRTPEQEEYARSILLGSHPAMRFGRRVFSRIPSDPRCKLCSNPFHGLGGGIMRLMGRGPWPKNPKYCTACFKELSSRRAGAEIECSLLFADVRGSTTLAESMRPAEFRSLMNRFFETAGRVLVRHDAVVDKFVGDEVMAIFIPAMTGELHAERAVSAARALLADTAGWVPIGVGVNTDTAYVGTVGDGDNVELTAMGDAVNVTSRLASAASAGEVLVTTSAATAARIDDAGIERRSLTLRGKTRPTDVLVLGAS